MGLLDKVKNLFTDEEVIETDDDDDVVDIREVKKEEKNDLVENKLPTFMREKIEKEEREKISVESKPDFALSSSSLDTDEPKVVVKTEINNSLNDKNSETSFKFPIDLEDSDFVETRVSRKSNKLKEESSNLKSSKSLDNVHSKDVKVASLYKDKKDEKKEEKKFKATPIISPIYGVLDKNYQASEVEQGDDFIFEKQRPSKSLDFDSVRKKAYGDLADDIKENLMCENCEYLKEVKECRKKIEDCEKNKKKDKDDLMYDILDNDDSKEDDITLETATENYYDYGVAYERSDNIIDYSNDSNDDGKENVKILNHTEEDSVVDIPKKEVPPVKSKINLLSTLKKSSGEEGDDTVISDGQDKDVSLRKSDDKDLELTDDLFSLIDSMYEERNDE